MVIADKSSEETNEDIRSAAKPLETIGIRIIAVAVGKEVDAAKLKSASSDGTVISSSSKDIPKKLGEEIMAKILEGQALCFVVVGIDSGVYLCCKMGFFLCLIV